MSDMIHGMKIRGYGLHGRRLKADINCISMRQERAKSFFSTAMQKVDFDGSSIYPNSTPP
jgi:hypothetical protein